MPERADLEGWKALRALGRPALADLVERTCHNAARFAKSLQAAGCQALNAVVLNQVLVSFGHAGATRGVIASVRAEGAC
jgi:glutamate/tyrosine decarboxylase-like PLP-dependent enzyme